MMVSAVVVFAMWVFVVVVLRWWFLSRRFLERWFFAAAVSFLVVVFWHAADTAPLEGLSILRCAIYDPVEGLQISKMRFSRNGGIGF